MDIEEDAYCGERYNYNAAKKADKGEDVVATIHLQRATILEALGHLEGVDRLILLLNQIPCINEG